MKPSSTLVKKKRPSQKRQSAPIRVNTQKLFPIVAIGASAGGLEAMSILLKNLPPDTGMAYIYVQHLSPDHKSYLTSILSKITKMKVQEIENMEHIAPDNVYVIPHDKGVEVTDGHIQLIPRPKSSLTNLTIDVLFTSLAETHKENVIGIILSGYASDGMIGLKAIKDAGGLTFAQDDSAQASSMPKSAISAGAVDFILPPEEIAQKLVQFSKKGFSREAIKGKQKKNEVESSNSDLNTIFEILLKETGVDFSHYKMPTIKRRLNHKMKQCGVKTIKEYVKLLLKKNNEADLLHKDLLINVTGFFRDAEAFRYLKNTLLPKLLKAKATDETLRIWVPACSTGEEAYSIAMLITELQDNKTRRIPVKVFATDLSEQAISDARIGEYSQSDIKPVPKKYIERFFTKSGDNYRIGKELREICVFAPHNILRDPPFSRMDFISCRNLLIYFDSAAQKKVISTLHFALNDGGLLLLGKAETIGNASQLFTGINNKFKIYSRKKSTGVRKIPELAPRFPRTNLLTKKASIPLKNIVPNPTGIESAIDAVLLSKYMPACVVVNKDMEILQFRGPVSLFLSHPPGKASLNILKMTKPEFAFELRTAIHKAIKTKQAVRKSGIEIKAESVLRKMTLEVSLLKIEWDEPLLLIVFSLQEQVEKMIETGKTGKNTSIQKDKRIKKLSEELNNTRSEMNAIIEAQESTYEELQAANEEIVSSNEEFQTLNEELETSKEEIEATNEELISTNQEMQVRNDLLTESHEYSEAIIATIHEPMLVLYNDFRVKSANKSFYKKFLVSKEETEGSYLFELGNKQWNILKLREQLNDVVSSKNSFKNFEVTHTFPGIGEKIMLLNAHPIIQKVNSEQLILLAIEDITERSRYYLKEKYSHSLIEASLDPLVTINTEGKITDMNHATVNITGVTRKKLTGTNFFDYFTEPKKAREVYKQVFAKGSVSDCPLILRNKDGKLTDVLLNGSVYKDDKGSVLGVVIVARDITERNKSDEHIKHLANIVEYSDDAIISKSLDGTIKSWNRGAEKMFGYSEMEVVSKNISLIVPPDCLNEEKDILRRIKNDEIIDHYETFRIKKGGEKIYVSLTVSPLKDGSGKITGVSKIARDISDQKRISTELSEAIVFAELATEIAEEAKTAAETAAQIAEDAVKAKQQFLSNMSHEIRTPMNAIIGFTKVVLKTELTAKQKEYLTAIKTSGDALIVLINDILDLAKVDAGKMSFEIAPFKIKTAISSMLHLFETKIHEKNLELIKDYDDKIPELLIGDSARLNQIILNLVSNAVKFTTKGKITVSLRLMNEDAEHVTIEFSISDTGIGIPANKTDKIFENFQQATSDTSRLYGGTGLGLAIVKQLVERQGGSIQVKSKIEKGSVFSFVLSFQKAKPEKRTEFEIGYDHYQLDNENKNLKVLVVEDIALNQLLMKTILDDFGFEGDVALNGKVAIEKLQTNAYDIILMDLQMPEMNGFEATRYIRNIMKSDVPIIALTADVTTVDLEKCKAAGMNDYIAKPVDEKLLYNKIAGLIKKPTSVDVSMYDQSKKLKCTDLNNLIQRTKSNPKLMMEMISLYLEQTPVLVSSMKHSLQEKDWNTLGATVHKMIPSFSIMGMSADFEKIAKQIHLNTDSMQNLDEIPDMVLQIENVCSQACAELKDEVNRIKNTDL